MPAVHDNPGRPPKHWIRDCIKGVRAGGSAKDPGAVCGSLWHHKLSDSQRRAILKKERAMGGLVENPHLHANPSGGTVLAVVAGLGVVGALAWLVLRKPEEAKLPTVKRCDLDLAKLQVFAMSKQLLGVYLANWDGYASSETGKKPAFGPPLWKDYVAMQPSDGVGPTGLPTWTPPLLVLKDGTFWTYDATPTFPRKRDDLREEYCAFAAGKFTRVSGAADPASLFVL